MNPASVQWNTFVMRLWSDTTSGTPRGEIVHLQTKESVHFATWDQAEAFIRRFAPGLESSSVALNPTDGPG
ncbi:MAG: hypothetical protein HW404_398 [Anaerolineales bacterium]|nr:hypothetical protein [Anaerolineales bacterium]